MPEKIPRLTQSEDYRPLTLLNADFKLLARIIANRTRPWINDLFHPSQHCGFQDNNILGAISAIRDTIAEAEITHTPVCILSLDFKGAFDNIGHSYLFTKLESYGFSSKFRQRLMRMYSNASSSVQVNGYISSPIPIKCSIRQRCPLSMLLFTMCLNPLLCMIDENLAAAHSGHHNKRTDVIAFADDVTIILRSPKDISIV